MNTNFSDLTPNAQREIFKRLCAFDAAAEWLARYSNLDISQVRVALLGTGALETANRDEDEIALFWADMDKSDSVIP
jgi:hypothetical protein